MARIGVFVCHCGHNIAGTVDTEAVAAAMRDIPGVVHSVDYTYMCSDPGQNLIRDAIKEHGLTGVVVAACSPLMHEKTFRTTVASAGLNPYLCEIANIREQCSWVHEDREEATAKAIDLTRVTVEKVKRNRALHDISIPVTKRLLVIGGGIAGIQVALDAANAGHQVILVEKEPSIGGRMAQLSETFPTMDCSQCILTPRMVECQQHRNITIYSYAEVENVEGYVGNFEVTIRKKARSVVFADCTGCGECYQKCPVKNIPSEFEAGLGTRTAIYVPFPQAVPNVPVIDREHCLKFTKDKCGICAKVCPKQCIDYEQEDELVTEQVGAIVLATGYETLGNDVYDEYGAGRFPDVITGLQFERMASASGPTQGIIRRPSDNQVPKTVVFIHCVGSRDDAHGREYCSRICCMYTAKHAILYKHNVPQGQAYCFYIDVRAGGKGYEEFYSRAVKEEDAIYLRGRVSRIYEHRGKLIVKGVDTLTASQVEVAADMVVLATAVIARPEAEALARIVGVGTNKHLFFSEAHPKLRPVETNTAGVFLAGCCQGPKDIPDSVAQASAAASKAIALFSSDNLLREPMIAVVDERSCYACGLCVEACPYKAIELVELKDRDGKVIREVARVNEGLCQGCGICAAACRANCIDLEGFRNAQLYAEISALSES